MRRLKKFELESAVVARFRRIALDIDSTWLEIHHRLLSGRNTYFNSMILQLVILTTAVRCIDDTAVRVKAATSAMNFLNRHITSNCERVCLLVNINFIDKSQHKKTIQELFAG